MSGAATRRGRVLATAAMLAAVAACGNASDDALRAASPPPATPAAAEPSAGATLSPSDLKQALRLAAISQESYFVDNAKYTPSVDELVRQGLEIPPGATVAVVSATDSRYCLSASFAGTTFYFDSATGKPSDTRCR